MADYRLYKKTNGPWRACETVRCAVEQKVREFLIIIIMWKNVLQRLGVEPENVLSFVYFISIFFPSVLARSL